MTLLVATIAFLCADSSGDNCSRRQSARSHCSRVFCFGLGPTIAKHDDFRLRLIPLGGSVRFLDTRSESVEPAKAHTAFDQCTVGAKVAISLSGCVALLLIGAACIGSELLRVFTEATHSLVSGALQPFTNAQSYVRGITNFANTAPLPELLGSTAVVFAAINLLPFPATNAGAAVAAVARGVGFGRSWPARATKALIALHVAFAASWSFALLLHLVWR